MQSSVVVNPEVLATKPMNNFGGFFIALLRLKEAEELIVWSVGIHLLPSFGTWMLQFGVSIRLLALGHPRLAGFCEFFQSR